MRSYPVKENHIGLAVSEILRYKQTVRQTDKHRSTLYYRFKSWNGFKLFFKPLVAAWGVVAIFKKAVEFLGKWGWALLLPSPSRYKTMHFGCKRSYATFSTRDNQLLGFI